MFARITLIRTQGRLLGNSFEDGAVSNMSPAILQRIFWPVYATRGRNAPGWIAGWMNSENDYFVFAILSEESVKVTR